ncbi:MAG: [protein-PII] uridylyltransferase [Mariniblastus sp.]
MTTGIGIRPSVLEARQHWRDGRQKIREMHDSGGTGVDVCHAMSDLLDEVLVGIYKKSLQEISPDLESRISLTLLGGCGRRDVAPYSDCDLMLLYQGSLTDDVVEFSRRISQDVTDAGMQLGYSLRTPREACTMSLKDAYIFSSLTEARLLDGNKELFKYFRGRFKRISGRKTSNIIKAIIAAREQERVEFGETVYLLRPNVKKSRGGLRDIHLIRWLGFVLYGERDIDRLLAKGALSTTDSTQLKESSEFLLRVRNEMHFHADRANDGLGRNEQVRLAERFGFSGDDALLSVEEFMREYFRKTSRIRYICDHFVSKSISRKKSSPIAALEPLVTRQIDDHFRMGATHVGVIRSSLDAVKSDLEKVLRLMQLACLHGKEIEHETWITIRHEMLKNPDIKFTRECARRFMALLSNTQGLTPLIRGLHEMKVLQKIIPGFEHARGLLQFNEYHKYTVDEHSIRAVDNVIKLENEPSVAGKTYQKIRDKNVLHLALLLHDLGKGFPEDHSEVGRRIAAETGERFDLPDDETETIKFLVHNHLVMSHLAFHRDINDQAMVAEFASNVGSVQLLSMLFVLTCADITAVGPGVFNAWKQGLLTDLFLNAKKILAGETDEPLHHQRYEQIYDTVALYSDDPAEQDWLRRKAVGLPKNYCAMHSPESIAESLMELRRSGFVCTIAAQPESSLLELSIGKVSSRRTGVFYKLAGMLSSLGLQIRSCDIKPLDDGRYQTAQSSSPLTPDSDQDSENWMWYWIQFEDTEFKETPQSRMDEIRQRASDLVTGVDDSPPRFRSVWKKEESLALKLSRPEVRVKINNETVGSATIIDVFAYDKTGLLYKLGKKLHRLGLDVTYARISTYAHQVIDVFYVTDEQGNKIRNRNQIQIIKREVLNAAKEFLEPPEDDPAGDKPESL